METLPPAFDALASRRQFIVYRVTPRKNCPNKTDKIPVDPSSLTSINCLDPKNQMTPEQALAECKKLSTQNKGIFGVGFVFTPEDDFFLIDIDNCLIQFGDKWDWSPLAKKIMGAFPNAAMEISTSCMGLHIIARGKVSAHGCRNAEHELEFYTENRFVALTGNSAIGDANTDHTATLTMFIAEYFPSTGNASTCGDIDKRWQEQVKRGVHPDWDGSADDGELIKCMLKSKPSSETVFKEKISIRELWKADETALAKAFPDNNRNHDASRADASLVQRLAFWTGNDAERMRQLMLLSELNRDKWQDHEDYLPRTILNACEKQNTFWKRKPPPAPINNIQPNPDSEWEEVSISDIFSHPEPPQYFLIESIVPAGVLTLLAANGGTGKSVLALLAAVCVAMGLPFMGKQVERGQVIFYSAEDKKGTIRRRMMRICKELSVDPSILAENLKVYDRTENPVLFHEVNKGGVKEGELTEEYKALHTHIKRYSSDLVIIDNASDTFAANENERIRVREFIRSLVHLVEETNGSVLLLAHVNKQTANGVESSESFSGSTQWHNSCRSRLFLTHKDNVLTLFHQKSNYGELSAPISMVWSSDGVLIHAPHNPLQAILRDENQYRSIRISILTLIDKYDKRGDCIPVDRSSKPNAYKLMKGDDAFFPGLVRDPDQMYSLLHRIEDDGLLLRKEYYKNRNKKEKYQLTLKAYEIVTKESTAQGTNTETDG